MSFYRSMLAAVAAIAIASPVFADDSATTTETTSTTTSSMTTSSTKVNINTASIKELTKVKGLTKANAKAIIAYRKAHGNFQSIDDLTNNVKGLKNLHSTTLEQLTVE